VVECDRDLDKVAAEARTIREMLDGLRARAEMAVASEAYISDVGAALAKMHGNLDEIERANDWRKKRELTELLAPGIVVQPEMPGVAKVRERKRATLQLTLAFRADVAVVPITKGVAMKDYAKLVTYTREELGTIAEYDQYHVKGETLRQIASLLPNAHVDVVGASWCGDCKRQIPRFARIAEHLSGWTIDLLGDDPATRERLSIKRIPTFIIRATAGGPELGRIVETPSGGSLEADLLAIVKEHPSQILA